jgi:hypothetical protein
MSAKMTSWMNDKVIQLLSCFMCIYERDLPENAESAESAVDCTSSAQLFTSVDLRVQFLYSVILEMDSLATIARLTDMMVSNHRYIWEQFALNKLIRLHEIPVQPLILKFRAKFSDISQPDIDTNWQIDFGYLTKFTGVNDEYYLPLRSQVDCDTDQDDAQEIDSDCDESTSKTYLKGPEFKLSKYSRRLHQTTGCSLKDIRKKVGQLKDTHIKNAITADGYKGRNLLLVASATDECSTAHIEDLESPRLIVQHKKKARCHRKRCHLDAD